MISIHRWNKDNSRHCCPHTQAINGSCALPNGGGKKKKEDAEEKPYKGES